MDTYKAVSKEIRAIYSIFTEKIEPLSLDEAFLDVSHCNTQAAIIAKEIRQLIYERTALTSSAGIAPNKMLAKVASDWNKPNGQFEITEDQIDSFMYELPVTELWGVGKQSLKKLYSLDIQTCGDIQKYNKIELYQLLGNWGISLFSLSRGIDNRQVKSSRKTKSISKETTFSENIDSLDLLHTKLNHLLKRLEKAKDSPSNSTYKIKNNVIKLKFADFSQTTVERSSPTIHAQTFKKLLNEAWKRGGGKPVRLLGAGLRFSPPDPNLELGLDMGHS